MKSSRTLLLSLGALALLGGQASADRLTEVQAHEAVTQRFGPEATVHWDRARGVPSGLFGLNVIAAKAAPEAAARAFLGEHGDLLGGLIPSALGPCEVTKARGGSTVRCQQMVEGLAVEGRSIVVRLDGAGTIRRVQSDFLPVGTLAQGPDIGAKAAQEAARAHVRGVRTGGAQKVVLALTPTRARVAYRVPVTRLPGVFHYRVYVDARDGSVVRAAPASIDQPKEVQR